jgi:hypothetical protein
MATPAAIGLRPEEGNHWTMDEREQKAPVASRSGFGPRLQAMCLLATSYT